MKKILTFIIVASFLMLASCNTITSNKNNYENELSPWLQKYVVEVIDRDIQSKLNDNPLDEAYYIDADKTQGTYDEIQNMESYINLWEEEMNQTLNNLNKALEKQLQFTEKDEDNIRHNNTSLAIQTLKESQKNWEFFYDNDVFLTYELNRSFAGRATIIPTLTARKKLNMVRMRTLFLKEYLSTFPDYEIEFYVMN